MMLHPWSGGSAHCRRDTSDSTASVLALLLTDAARVLDRLGRLEQVRTLLEECQERISGATKSPQKSSLRKVRLLTYNLLGHVLPRQPAHAAAWVRGRAAQEQLLDRGVILGKAGDWSQEKGLCKRHIAAVQVPFA
jgi:hypothetical protein